MQNTIRLRADVKFLRKGPDEFLVLNGRTGDCYSVAAEERYLVYLLEHTESLEKVLAAFEARFGRKMAGQQVLDFVEQLRRRQLLSEGLDSAEESPAASPGEAPSPLTAPILFANRSAKQNFAFDLLVLVFGWVLHPIWIGPILLLALGAVNVGVRHGNQLIADFRHFVDPYPVLLYLVLLVVPKLFALSVIQAILAGMACRRFGGRIRTASVRFRAGILPVFRTQPDHSLVLMNRRGRLTYMSIGFWTALTVCSVSMLGWAIAAPDSSARTLCVILIPPCLIRLLIQCNVFYRYSSAHMLLSQAAGEWKLLELAWDETRRWLTGRGPSPRLSERKRHWLRLFGLGYVVYRVLMVVFLIGGVYLLVCKYAGEKELPVWFVEYVLIAVTLISSWNRDFRAAREPEEPATA